MNTIKVPLIVMGLGRVGRETVRQVLDARQELMEKCGISFSFTALTDSQALVGSGAGMADGDLEKILAHKAAGKSLKDFPGCQPLAALPEFFHRNIILADTSASAGTAPMLLLALDKGGAAVLANKLPLALPWDTAAAFFGNLHLRCESTVGAGLPVIVTLESLLAGGDEITKIEGCMSGTLGFIASQLELGRTFSEAVTGAFQAGYTEPDPRQDLGGLDVARKALILARTAGISAEMADILLEPLFPESLADISIDEFMRALPDLNGHFHEREEKAVQQGKVLRYLACITPEAISVGLEAVPKNSALGALQGTDNYFAFHTRRYSGSPLVIAGPGAGISVTAAGVVSDLINLANSRERQPFQ